MSFGYRLRLRFGIIGLGIGVALAFAGWEDFSISSKTKTQPTTITAAQLSKSGPPKDNAYVHITDYDLNQQYIIESKDDSKLWDRAWLQVVPRGQTESAGKPIIVKDDNISSEDDLNQFGQQSSFDGIVTNGITSISPPKTPSGMQFPEVSQSKDWLVEVRNRPDTGTACGFTIAGLVFLLGGGFLTFTGFATRGLGPTAKGGTIISSNVGGRKRR